MTPVTKLYVKFALAIAMVLVSLKHVDCAMENVLVYIPGWAHKPTATGTSYFDITKVNLTGVTHVCYAFGQFSSSDFKVQPAYGNSK